MMCGASRVRRYPIFGRAATKTENRQQFSFWQSGDGVSSRHGARRRAMTRNMIAAANTKMRTAGKQVAVCAGQDIGLTRTSA